MSYTCRICLDEEIDRSLVLAPCLCSGSSKWVHRSCLDRWRSTRADKAFSQCTECLAKYKLVSTTADNPQKVCLRKCKYAAFLVRDFLSAFLVLQLTIFLCAYFVYGLDGKDHYLATLVHLPRKSAFYLLFYYSMGLLILLSLVGIIYFFSRFEACRRSDCCGQPCYCDSFYFWPYYFSSDVATTGATAAGADPVMSSCCCCHECGQCGTCLSLDCGECLGCAGVTVGEEAFICIAVLVVVFAVVGVIVSVFIGAAFVQHITQKHVHILHKWNLAQDYIVQDLADDGIVQQRGTEMGFQNYLESRKSSDGEDEKEDLICREGVPRSGNSNTNLPSFHGNSSIINRRERGSLPLISTRVQTIDRFDIEANAIDVVGEEEHREEDQSRTRTRGLRLYELSTSTHPLVNVPKGNLENDGDNLSRRQREELQRMGLL